MVGFVLPGKLRDAGRGTPRRGRGTGHGAGGGGGGGAEARHAKMNRNCQICQMRGVFKIYVVHRDRQIQGACLRCMMSQNRQMRSVSKTYIMMNRNRQMRGHT